MDLAVKPRIRKDEVQQIIDQRLAAILEKEISSPMSPKGESNSKSLGKRCVELDKASVEVTELDEFDLTPNN